MEQANEASASQKPVWFITGCSTGFGRHLAECALARGYSVVVTARNLDSVKDFENSDSALILQLDVTDEGQIAAAISTALDKFGHIDVLVNNAGIGYLGAIEESEEFQVRKMFDVNVFGLSRMVRAVLPSMRKRRKGFIVNFSSVAGLRAFPALGFYSATKFAVEAVTEALWQEVEPLGIKVMLVEPGGFRTQWLNSVNESAEQIDDYAETAGMWRNRLHTIADSQPGDPVRAALAILAVVDSCNPPHRLLLGKDALDRVNEKLNDVRKDLCCWESVSRSADFPRPKLAQVPMIPRQGSVSPSSINPSSINPSQASIN